MTPQPQAILFDLDGTLVHTAPEITDAVNDTLLAFQCAPLKEDVITACIGRGAAVLLRHALAISTDQSEAAVEQWPDYRAAQRHFLVAYAKRAATRSHPYAEVANTLEALGQHGIKLGVLTNKDQGMTYTTLRYYELMAPFSVVVCGDSYARKKPDPIGAVAAMDALQTEPEHTLMVGDSKIDVQTARNAGMPVWAVDYGYNFDEDIALAEPDRIISDFQTLNELITP